MIEARSLTKSYNDLVRGAFVALSDLSFRAEPGQIYGLLGPNGAGKTTALRILSTVLEPTSGTAVVGGFDCVTQPELVRHQIGFISANTAVYDRMTAWEMVEYFGRLYGLEDDELRDRMEQLFERFQMHEIRDLLGAKMSTGMKQKVSIARAIVHDPPVLILTRPRQGSTCWSPARCSMRWQSYAIKGSALCFRPISCARPSDCVIELQSCIAATFWQKAHWPSCANCTDKMTWKNCSFN